MDGSKVVNLGLAWLVAAVFLPLSAQAWDMQSKVDSMTDESNMTATVKNGEGHTFTVYRQKDGSIWALFALSSKTGQTLSPKTMPVIRVDKYPPNDFMHDVELQALLAKINGTPVSPAYLYEPKRVHAKLWHGDDAQSRATVIDQLGQGKTLLVRYYLFTGGYKETLFALAPSGPFYQALALSAKPARHTANAAP